MKNKNNIIKLKQGTTLCPWLAFAMSELSQKVSRKLSPELSKKLSKRIVQKTLSTLCPRLVSRHLSSDRHRLQVLCLPTSRNVGHCALLTTHRSTSLAEYHNWFKFVRKCHSCFYESASFTRSLFLHIRGHSTTTWTEFCHF